MLNRILKSSSLRGKRWQSNVPESKFKEAQRVLPQPYTFTLAEKQLDELGSKFKSVDGGWENVDLHHLFAASLHLGHAPHHLNDFNLSYIYGERAGVHVINLEHTLTHLRRAANVVREVSMRGGSVLFVGTRPRIQHTMVEAARRSGQFFCVDWRRGHMTNRARTLIRSAVVEPRPRRDNFVGLNLEPLVSFLSNGYS
jgi:hypothetical protein